MTAALPQMARSFGASLLRRYAFRRVLLVNGTLTSLACADAIDPYTVIAIVLFAAGLTRSQQFSALNSPAFADVPSEQTGAEYLGERRPAVDIWVWLRHRSRGGASRLAAES
jgi:hypothetical protein